ncbi:MAG: DUF4932 domain-containing protein [Clostridiales bacterium]|nr:DUF4932 domain-containing protein [Clostridiales bacterium]
MKKVLYCLTGLIMIISFIGCEDENVTSLSNDYTNSESQAISSEISEVEDVILEERSGLVVILPRVELLAGVLSQTSWMDIAGPSTKGNAYFQELKAFFKDYKDHDAVKIAEQLTKNGFSYDAPLGFILTLEELPNLENVNGYSDYIINRAGDEKTLEEFRLALRDLSKESNFMEFYNDHQDTYDKCIEASCKNFDEDVIMNWMEDFYGYLHGDYGVVLAPSMFPGGGYGATITDKNGIDKIYQIVREPGQSQGEPKFNTDLFSLTIHEWGHGFINPIVGENSDKVELYELNRLYEPVKEKMSRMAYSSVETFLNEQIIRALTAYAVRDIKGDSYFKVEQDYNTNKGFYLTEFTVEQIGDYLENRDIYETLDDFIPVLLERYYENMEMLLDEIR